MFPVSNVVLKNILLDGALKKRLLLLIPLWLLGKAFAYENKTVGFPNDTCFYIFTDVIKPRGKRWGKIKQSQTFSLLIKSGLKAPNQQALNCIVQEKRIRP